MSSGRLCLTVVEAKLIRDTETFGKMDPYCVLNLRGQKYKTNVLDGAGKNPKWNQTFDIVVHSTSDDMTVVVWDEEVMSDDLVGEATIRIADLIAGGSGTAGAWLDIYYKKQKAGQVLMKCNWASDGGSPKREKVKEVMAAKPSASPKRPVAAVSGALALTVVEAKLTRDTEVVGKMDPYCVMTLRGQKYRSNTIDSAGKNPKWNQTFDISIQDTRDEMIITVMDEDVMSDDKVGEATVRVADLLTIHSGAWIDIFWKNKKAGQVLMKSQWYPAGTKKEEVVVVHKPVKKEKVVHAAVPNDRESRSYTYQNGSTYNGEWQGIRRHGRGTFKQPSGSIYVGEFHNDRRHGKGQLTYPDGCKYTGEWREDLRVGQGLFEWLDGNSYDGDFKDDHMNGNGTFTWRSGAKYHGAWRHNKKNGHGTMYYRDGSVFVGSWKDDRRDGEGVMTWKNGAKYEGQWHNDIKHGHGAYTWENGCKYTGDWVNGRRSGSGVCTYPDGGKYQGSFKNNVKDGQGTFTGRDGSAYTGEWSNDEKHGRGNFTWPDRTTFSGNWHRGDMKGGKLVGPDGREQDM